MLFFQSKLLIFLTHMLLLIIDFANLFLTDILMYEATTGLDFDYNAMFHNVLFWVLLSLHLLHIIITKYISKKNVTIDQIVEEAIAHEQIKLLSQATLQTEKGNFEDADNVLKVYDELTKRRKK